ncbi:cysteine dioxygenase family protein [Streptosporangium sandarakinum]|uniref:Putative metal-dependent enzyme (Double-stranded beta helix superfamily) n=1 Tax=Streptosporangium sandarakinum TaxID=1260955 RepID=A0A852UXE2_9ACTN|nr:cysteine dioxygenase family protein [Streptosporangium sandarakinum]NYF39734.1 putative metal-dependent enzyme (double-stranded beta helix superfamily) [Streptosporangium sandarakinum]
METTVITRPGLAELVEGTRGLVAKSMSPRETAFAVADLLRERLPAPGILTEEERAGDPDRYVTHVLHTEADLSVVAIVWRPGQETVIHDHVAWCVFGVLQGVEYETLYRLDGDHLTEIGRTANRTGEVSGFAPPGDIHRVRNIGDGTAISLHIYGADLGDTPTSVRRVYDLPVR